MNPVSIEQYFGQYAEHPDLTSEIRAAAAAWIEKWNAGLLLAEHDGVMLRVNPITGCLIAGSGNGGIRPRDCPIGASASGHKKGRAGDTHDPERELVAWSIANESRLRAIGILAMEDPRWTPTWCHWQDFEVPSGHFVFIPSSEPALAAAPAPWQPRQAIA